MKKIFDWTVGSFFRTIGRTIAFLIMGVIIYYILSSNGFGLEDLFFDKVNASTWSTTWVSSSDYKIGDNGSWNNMNLTNDKFYSFQQSLNGQQVYFTRFNNGPFSINSNAKLMRFNVKMRVNSSDEITTYYDDITCAINNTQWDFYQNSQQTYDTEFEYTSFDCQTGTSTSDIDYKKFSLTLGYWYNNNTGFQTPCYAIANSGDTYSFECPVVWGDIGGLVFNISTNNSLTFSLGYNYLFSTEIDMSQSIIDSQNQNTQTIIENQQNQTDQLLEDNTTQAENEIGDFLGNFTVEDFGGLSAIITAPLNTINSLLSSTCTNLVLPLPFVNENLTLPCMNTIYNTHFGLFFNLYQTIILAIVSYRCIRSIYFDIHGFTNPDDDRIEVMDL